MEPMFDLAPAAQQVRDLLPRITDEQLSAPTPCDQTDVAGLLSHLVGLTAAFRDAARKGPSGGPPGQMPPLDDDWRERLPQNLDELVAAWREPDAWEGMAEAGGREMAATDMAVVTVDELVLHGWDLARATGQETSVDAASEAAVHGFVSAMAEADPSDREGLFGPIVAVPDDAPRFDQILALSGRDPQWSPTPAVNPAS